MESFEVFTKGVGSKIMTSLGWRNGEGLRKNRIGIATLIKEAGQVNCPEISQGLVITERKLSLLDLHLEVQSQGTIL